MARKNDIDFLREGIRLLGQRVIELEVSEQIGAGRYVRKRQPADTA